MDALLGAVVVREMMDGHRPPVWISDRYTAQRWGETTWRRCLWRSREKQEGDGFWSMTYSRSPYGLNGAAPDASRSS